MRITRKVYEKARAAVEAAREQIKVVKAWEDAVRRVGHLGNQELVAITLDENGAIRTECELLPIREERSVMKATEKDSAVDDNHAANQ